MELLWRIEGIRTPFLDTLFGLITRLGEEMILIVLFCVLFWCINKKWGYIMGTVFFLSSLAVQGMKIIFRIPRPWVADPNFSPIYASLGEATGYAFPSGHTQNAAAWLGSLGALIKNKIVKICLFTLTILVAFSRMYLGVHTIQDVIVSLIITFAILFFTLKFFDGEESKKRDFFLSLFIVLCAVIVLAIVIAMYFMDITEAVQLRDAVLAAGAAIGFGIGMFIERTYIRFSVKTKNIPLQVLKCALGIAGLIAIQEGLRIIGSNLLADGIRYFFMIMWLTVGYPLIIKKFFAVEEK